MTTEIEELIQLTRTLKTSQIRKQLEHDQRQDNRFLDSRSDEWVRRFQLVKEFFNDAKEQS
jgi:hypothetical protein